MIDEVRRLTEELYSRRGGGAGCCLHILTDDSNIDDDDVDFCIRWAEQEHHDDCLALAKLYRQLTLRERALVLDMGWCPRCEAYSCCDICHDCGGPLCTGEAP